jgi:outer membrane protein assembly factor BamB
MALEDAEETRRGRAEHVTIRQAKLWVAGLAAAGILAACQEKELILPGERITIRDAVGVAPVVDSAPQGAPIALPGVQANADWSQRGGNARHAAPHAALAAAPQLIWSAPVGTGSSRKNRIAAAPVVAGGRVFAMDAEATVTAVSTGGGLLWSSDLTADFDRGGGASGGGLAADGTRLYVTTVYGEVVALDAGTGAVIWRQRVDAPAVGAPAVADGMVYVSGRDGSAWAIAGADGKVQWQAFGAPGKAGYLGSSAPTVGDRAVIFPSNAGDLMAVLRIGGGTKIWHSSLAGKRLGRAYAANYDVTGDAALLGGVLYAGTAAGRTEAIDAASGKSVWSADEGALGPLVVAGGSVFLVSDEARLVRLDAGTGLPIWSVEMPYYEPTRKVVKRKAIYAHYGPVLAGGRIWVASSDGLLRAFSPVDGSLVYSTEIPGGAATQPAVAGGTLYVVSEKGQLLAFR